MSTRGSTWTEGTPTYGDDWQPTPRTWCPTCCQPTCTHTVPTIGANIVLGSE